MKKSKMKRKIVSIFFSILFSICFITTAPISTIHAAATGENIWQDVIDIWNYVVNSGANKDDVNNVNKNVDSTKEKIDDLKNSIADESKKGIASFFDSQNTTADESVKAKSAASGYASAQEQMNEWLWGGILLGFKTGEIPLGGDDDDSINFDTASFINDPNRGGRIANVFKIFGYSLVLLLFSVSLIDQTIKYEIFTLRGSVNIFGRLLLSKLIIDMATNICLLLISISQGLCNKILGELGNVLIVHSPQIETEASNLWIVGDIVDYLVMLLLQIPVQLILLTVLISGILIMIKLLLRSFELTMLTAVSPAFFACFSSQTTNQYFKNFITTFLQCSFQIIFMAVVYYVAITKLTIQTDNITTFADLGGWLVKVLPNAIIILAMAIMMVKPPKVLTGLIHA